MKPAPSKVAEAVVGFLIPPACREEGLGDDLHERYTGPLHYLGDALSAVPCVIISRIRRTTDPQVLLMEAFALYLSFVGVAWISGQAFLYEPWGLLRLAIPTAVALVALVLVDAYANPSKRSLVKGMLQTGLGIGSAFLSQATFWATDPEFALPLRIMLYGAGTSLVLVSALRVFFAPDDNRPRGAT